MQNLNKLFFIFIFFIFFYLNFSYGKTSIKLKDLITIEGLKENQVMGFGLVVALQGTGDSKNFKMTKEMLKNLATNNGFNITEKEIESKNVAAVMVTAILNPFSRIGEKINVSVSSIGDCKSLEGGYLLQTALKGADDVIYAVAQGKLITGKRGLDSTLYATIPGGGIIEKEVISNFIFNNKISLILKYPDFTTITKIKDEVKKIRNDLIINIIDPSKIEIELTEEELRNPAEFIAKIESIMIEPDEQAVVIIDKKSGTIVAGGNVIIQECLITVGNIQVNVKKQKNNLFFESQNIKNFVDFLNNSGLTGEEIISVLESLDKAGLLYGKLIIL